MFFFIEFFSFSFYFCLCVDFILLSLVLYLYRHGSSWRAYRRASIGRGISLLFSSYSDLIRGIRGSGDLWCCASYITQLSGLKMFKKRIINSPIHVRSFFVGFVFYSKHIFWHKVINEKSKCFTFPVWLEHLLVLMKKRKKK